MLIYTVYEPNESTTLPIISRVHFVLLVTLPLCCVRGVGEKLMSIRGNRSIKSDRGEGGVGNLRILSGAICERFHNKNPLPVVGKVTLADFALCIHRLNMLYIINNEHIKIMLF